MAKQKVKCPECGTMNEKENTVPHNNRYYCKECYESKSQSVDGYKRLIGYICRLYRIDKPTGIILRQIKEFKTDYQFTDDGIYMTLKYYYELLGNSVLEGVGIGIVPYYYDKAKHQYLTMVNIEEMSESYSKDSKRIVNVDIGIRDKMMNDFKRKTLDFDDMDWSELDE